MHLTTESEAKGITRNLIPTIGDKPDFIVKALHFINIAVGYRIHVYAELIHFVLFVKLYPICSCKLFESVFWKYALPPSGCVLGFIVLRPKE